MSEAWCCWRDGDLILRIWAQPRAKRNEITGPYGDFLKVRVSAPPTDGRANRDLIKLLAATLDIAPSRITLVAGAGNRGKTFHIAGPLPADACRLFAGN